jgi:4-hydroxy-tetrahydrodipicolinate reductase
MKSKYRIMVWGPGGMGMVAIWEIAQSEAFELVGVRAYSEAKANRDVGELFGLPPMGIVATTDVDALIKTKCDCIIYTPRDDGTHNADEELLRLLAAGHNVVTPLPYQNVHLIRESGFVERLKLACQQGQSVFHATGIDPDIISDRILLGLTGMCTDVKAIKLQENWEMESTAGELLTLVGYGKSPEEARKFPAAANIAYPFFQSIGYTVAEQLGVEYGRIELTSDYIPAHKDILSPNLLVKAGTVGRVTHRFLGFAKGSETEPFFTFETNWVLGHEMLPEGVLPDQYWVITIEGRPSIKTVIDLRASLKSTDRFYQIGTKKADAGYHATIAPCLQAIPVMCRSASGILPSFSPQTRWMADFRDM